MSPLTWRVDTGAEAPHVSLQGRPDTASLTALRRVFERHCDTSHGGLTVDLSALGAIDQASVIRTAPSPLHSSMTCGPTALLCPRPPYDGTGPGRPAALPARMGRDQARSWEALTLGPLRGQWFAESLLPMPGAARRGRQVVARACAEWRLPHLAPAATLIATELVTHVIEDASTMMTVAVLLYGGTLYVSIRSGGPLEAQPRNGYLALAVVHSLAGRWGIYTEGVDLLTWAALPTS